MMKSKSLDVCDSCYIFRNYYKSLKEESYEKSYGFIDDDDDYYYDDDAMYGYGKILISSLMYNWRCKIHIHKIKVARPFIRFLNNPRK